MQLIGPIVRLQLQPSSLTLAGPDGARYDPTPLRTFGAVTVGADGVLAEDADGRWLDVHHLEHPRSKHRPGRNAISVGFTAHYAAMRERLGDHLADGLAGENILVQSDRVIQAADLAGGLAIQTRHGGLVRLVALRVAEPCVPFTHFGLGGANGAPSSELLQDTLRFLRGGMRGFYAHVEGGPARVRLGDQVYRL